MSRQTKSVLMRSNERERLRVAATVTQEREWPQNEPNQGLARMFVVMLLIHVVVIGGVIIYDFVGEPEDAKPVASAPTAAPKTAAPAPTPAPKAVASEPRTPVQPVPVLTAEAPAITTPPAAIPVKEDSVPAAVPVTAPAALLPQSLLAGSTTVVDLPMAPEVKPGPATTTASMTPALTPVHEAAPAVKPKVESVKTEAPKPKVEKAVALGAAPKPVMTPSAARSALAKDVKKPPTTVVQKKAEPTKPAPAKKTASASRHTVSKGDTIYGIARRYKVSEKALMQANGISNPNALRLGKALVIPR